MGYRIHEMPEDWVGVSNEIAADEDDVGIYRAADIVPVLAAAWEQMAEEHRSRALVITICGDATNYMQLGYFRKTS
jgi:hypothetical protein